MSESTATRPGAGETSLWRTSQQFKGALAGAISHPENSPEATPQPPPEPQEPPRQQREPEPEPEYEEANSDEPEEVESEEYESADYEAADEDSDDDGELRSFETLDDLASHLGLSADELLNIRTRTKIDGEENEVTLADLRKNYQLEGNVRKQEREIAERRKQIEAQQQEYQSRVQQADSRIEQLDTLSQALQKRLVGHEDMEHLRQYDPEGYQRAWIDQQQVRQQLQEVEHAKHQQWQEKARQQQERQQEFLEQQRKQLPELIPEWRDSEVAAKETKQIRDFLVQAGFDEQEVSQVADARLVKIARDAMRYHTMSKSKPEVSKKVRRAPKMQKPGATQSKQARAEQDRQERMGRLKKSGSTRDAAQVLKGII